MKTITLQILATDIMETNYCYPKDCPIARAFKRAGFSNIRIDPVVANVDDHCIGISDLDLKVRQMYAYNDTESKDINRWWDLQGNSPISPADFIFDVTIND